MKFVSLKMNNDLAFDPDDPNPGRFSRVVLLAALWRDVAAAAAAEEASGPVARPHASSVVSLSAERVVILGRERRHSTNHLAVMPPTNCHTRHASKSVSIHYNTGGHA